MTEDLAELLRQRAELEARIMTVLVTEAAQEKPASTGSRREPEHLLTPEQLAERMEVKKTYVYDHADEWPFTKRHNGLLRFSEKGFERWVRSL
jgi:hypothetical protein